jgi:tetratricopeptide (TPR) repeat protein
VAPAPAPAAHDAARARALRASALAAYDDKRYPSCAALFADAMRADDGKMDEDEYSAACCLALAGDRDAALSALERAVDVGWRNRAGMDKDDDLASLRGDARFAALGARIDAEKAKAMRDANPELAQLYDEDQAGRSVPRDKIDWTVLAPRDAAHRKRVREILDGGGARVALDYYHAAMIFQHGESVDDYHQANQLARKAVELDAKNRQARWLVAATADRELMKLGKPQRYATQYRKVDGVWVLYDVDPSVTDEERSEWAAPSLDEAKAHARAMNGR